MAEPWDATERRRHGFGKIKFVRRRPLIPAVRHFNKMRKFSLTNLLLLTAAVAAASLAYSYRVKLQQEKSRADAIQSELNNSRPISFGDVAWQVRQATKSITNTNVPIHSIHYNSLRDRYRLDIGWMDNTTLEEIGTGIVFEPNGDGSYTGWLLTQPFAKLELNGDGDEITIPFYITIKDNVRRHNDLLTEHGYEPLRNPNWRTKD
ncbi:MAG: hypothetical protein R3C53_27920 [Pirellulaceae bacterium]